MQVRNRLQNRNKYHYLSTKIHTAERLHPNDLVRIERAMEIYLITEHQ